MTNEDELIQKLMVSKQIMQKHNTIGRGGVRNVDYSTLGKFNIYFFDGPHEEDDQYDALSYALPSLDDTFILIVDDWNDPRPRNGTEKAIKELDISILYSMQIRTSNGVDVVYPTPHVLENSDWHNGYYIAVCKK